MDINNVYVRDAILYYTIQQYFNCNDKKTSQFITQLDHFNYRSGLIHNIPYLSLQLHVSEKDFYHTYLSVKESFKILPESFKILPEDVILVKKNDEIYSKLLAMIQAAPPYLFLKGNVYLLNEKSVSVVGSRDASREAMEKTEILVKA